MQSVADKCGSYYESIPHGLKFTMNLYRKRQAEF